MLKEFRDFALKGNVLDLAIGVIMATTFGAVVKSAISDVLMPIIGLVFHQRNFNEIKILESIEIGKFITEAVNFLIVAAVLFLIVKAANKAMGGKVVGHGGHDEEAIKESLKEQMERK